MARLLLVALLAVLAACASVIGARTVEVPLARLQQQAERAFPKEQRVLAVFDLRLSQPRLSLDPASHGLQLRLAVDVAQPLGAKHWQGELLLKGRLQLDRQRQAVTVAELRPAGLTLNGRGSLDFGKDAPVLDRLAEKLGRELVLYQFKPDELRLAGVQFQPLALRVRADALAFTFEPQ
ncbi:DUF1439 domain-containing protein [Massilia sp. TS11]|uniref:DUF1439 domain-containing protein n=1 Tax=Massilia sp. TS11 TaxID=2908003 RepID=UPI001EDC1A6E|nr:DUF1439 domain-containing protein [Massilia sp. TS11]MCG2586089.1 DUF1439 domain-containing protein [Massilia sp. TS11]